jgi:hypothetical protein
MGKDKENRKKKAEGKEKKAKKNKTEEIEPM